MQGQVAGVCPGANGDNAGAKRERLEKRKVELGRAPIANSRKTKRPGSTRAHGENAL